jgi:hypothetical protein
LEPFFTFEGSSGAIALSGGCINADTAVTFPFEQRLGRIADKLQPVKSRTGLARFFQRLVGAGKYRDDCLPLPASFLVPFPRQRGSGMFGPSVLAGLS